MCLQKYVFFTPVLQPGDYGHNNRVKMASAVKELNAKAEGIKTIFCTPS